MRRLSLNIQILLGAILGIGLGVYLHGISPEQATFQNSVYAANVVGTLFIDLLKMILVPLVFCSIAVGIANLRQHQQINRVWVVTLMFFIGSMAIAIALGLAASNYFKPGLGLHLDMFQNAMQAFEAKQLPLSEFFTQFLHGLFLNPFTALAQGNVLAVVVFALILGIALVVGGERYKNILALFQEGLEIIMRMVGWIMHLAPFGIMALLVKLVAVQDVTMLNTLAKFVAVVVGTTLFHGIFVATGLDASIHYFRVVPTADLSTTLGLSTSVLLICLFYNIKIKGMGGWFHELTTAPFGGHPILWPINFAFQMIEFMAKTVSHGMRLFGNMYAGELVFMLIALMGGTAALSLTGILLPLGHIIAGSVWAIFHIMIVALQAFIFMMLTLVYIGQAHDAH